MFVQTDDSGRIVATTAREEWAGPGSFEFDFPEGFDFDRQNDYTIVDGALVENPAQPPIGKQIAQLKDKLNKTDYIVVKSYEAQLSGIALASEDAERYAGIIEQRAEWRRKINELGGAEDEV